MQETRRCTSERGRTLCSEIPPSNSAHGRSPAAEQKRPRGRRGRVAEEKYFTPLRSAAASELGARTDGLRGCARRMHATHAPSAPAAASTLKKSYLEEKQVRRQVSVQFCLRRALQFQRQVHDGAKRVGFDELQQSSRRRPLALLLALCIRRRRCDPLWNFQESRESDRETASRMHTGSSPLYAWRGT